MFNSLDPVAVIGAIAGVLGTFLGTASLYLHWRTNRADRSELALEARMGIAQSVAHPEHHPYIEVVLRNIGRRVIRIHDIWIDVPVSSNPTKNLDGTTVTLVEERIPLLKDGVHLLLAEHERYVLRHDPFSNDVAKMLGPNCVKLKVEDSLGRVHETLFQPSIVSDRGSDAI